MSTPASCSPRVAVVTPFCNEPADWLAQAQRSITAQTYPCDHIMVGDAATVVPPLPAMVVNLPTCVADFGDTPRAVGSFYAVGLGYDAIAYLDADNWFDPEHIASLVTLYLQTNAAVVTSRRAFVRIDGSYMAECTASDGDSFSDTNCLFITRAGSECCRDGPLWIERFTPLTIGSSGARSNNRGTRSRIPGVQASPIERGCRISIQILVKLLLWRQRRSRSKQSWPL